MFISMCMLLMSISPMSMLLDRWELWSMDMEELMLIAIVEELLMSIDIDSEDEDPIFILADFY